MPFIWGALGLLLVAGGGAGAIYLKHFSAHQSGGLPVLDLPLKQAAMARSGLKAEPLPEYGLPDGELQGPILLDLEKDAARAMNAAVPFADVVIVAAPPFMSKLDGIDRDRARACLAVAAVFEAGEKVNDQSPVMQVVLNRVRHPAFPNSVCEVVFQGADAPSGCQFSFTCDGSMTRYKPGARALANAMQLAEWMLTKGVDERVGHATHYHTDWVVPRWSPKLNKLAKINTHIFLGWTGFWGQKKAFRERAGDTEALMPQLAGYSVAHGDDIDRIDLDAEEWAELNAIDAATLQSPSGDNSSGRADLAARPAAFFIPTKKLTFGEGMTPGRWALDAAAACGDLPDCRVVGWGEPSRTPGLLDRASISRSPPDLVFVQNLRSRIQIAYWDCAKWGKASTSKCLGSSSERLALVDGSLPK